MDRLIVHYLLRRDCVHMEKVVVSLGGSVLVPGDDDARYLRSLAGLLRDVSVRVKLFVVTGGGRIARYYIETGRSLGIGERTLDEFGMAVTRLNARLLERLTFRALIDLAGKGHAAAGPSIVFDPVAARLVARDRTPLSVVYGRDPVALRSAILGQPFRGTLVVD